MQTLFIGKPLVFLSEVNSTNTYAMNLLRDVNVIEGTVIYTDNQTNGRGQRLAQWHSSIATNLTLSCILKPSFLQTDSVFYLSKISALAVYDLLTEILSDSQYDIKIKWPNDILVNKRKIAGILIENNINRTVLQHAVIGIGINVNQVDFGDLNSIAISLRQLTNQQYDRKIVLEKLCAHIEKWYLKLKLSKFEDIDEAYSHRLFGKNQIIDFKKQDGLLFKGYIKGVTKEGKLVVEMIDSSVYYFDIKELQFVI
jgi:BirA family biotin operon repressor/biotin-[acetyl-CoA-carboxylase] ligase